MAPLVFFSSTTEDLQAYRAAVRKAVVALDILYRGMEVFGSQPQTPQEAIMDELVKCDAYVGIVAQRYGSIAPGTGLSFTELEYELARKNQIPAFIFLINERHQVRDSYKESSPENREKLEKFKERLREAYVFETFTTPGDLAAKVLDSLNKWVNKEKSRWDGAPQQWRVNDFDHKYIRKLHSQRTTDVEYAIEGLGVSDNPIVQEHLYARLYGELGKGQPRRLLLSFTKWQNEERLRQMLFGLADDLQKRRADCIWALGKRALLNPFGMEDVRFVLQKKDDTDSNVRYEVAHALEKFYNKPGPIPQEVIEAVENLSKDTEARVRDKASEVLAKMRASQARKAQAT